MSVLVFEESQSEMSTLELELKKVSDQKQDLERKLRIGEDDKASFEKVGASFMNHSKCSEASRKCTSLHYHQKTLLHVICLACSAFI